MIFFGGALQIIGAIMEWVLGNTFSMCLFFTYGTFWVVAGTQLVPWFSVGVQYSSSASNLQGMTEPAYYATFGEYTSASVSSLAILFPLPGGLPKLDGRQYGT
jgi:succinate-acetate transporter protein